MEAGLEEHDVSLGLIRQTVPVNCPRADGFEARIPNMDPNSSSEVAKTTGIFFKRIHSNFQNLPWSITLKFYFRCCEGVSLYFPPRLPEYTVDYSSRLHRILDSG